MENSNNRPKFAFVCGSFKPFNENHRKLVDYYQKNCDYVFVIVSNPQKDTREDTFGNIISAQKAKDIIQYVIDDCNWDNVKVKVSKCNPIQTMLGYASRLKDCDIILGTSDKDDDIERYADLQKSFHSDNNVKLLPIEQTAYHIEDSVFSSSDIRDNIDDAEYVKNCLPKTLSDEHVNTIMNMLQENTDFIASLEENDEKSIEKKIGARIFEELLHENDEDNLSELVQNEMDEEEEFRKMEASFDTVDEEEMIDEEERFDIDLTDEAIQNADCGIIAYGMHVDENEDVGAYNPKNNPDKAIDIVLDFKDNGIKLEIFLDTKSLSWDSWINDREGKLSPNQMQKFFNSGFYKKIHDRLTDVWPEKDEQFKDLLDAINNKKYRIDFSEDNGNEEQLQEGGDTEREKRSERKWEQIDRHERSASGRKYITPSNFSVKHDENEAYFCWPKSKGRGESPEFKWSQWADWEKIKPLARMRFTMGASEPHVYGITISPLEKADKNRGFRAYDLTAQPPLQYLSPQETQMLMDLDIVKKFLKNVIKRITKYLSIDDEEILSRVDKPEKCTIDDIRKTKHCIKNALDAIRNRRADTYIYT